MTLEFYNFNVFLECFPVKSCILKYNFMFSLNFLTPVKNSSNTVFLLVI